MAPDASPGLTYLSLPAADAALLALSAPLRDWFLQSFGAATAAQRLAWPALVEGHHLLLSSPTGSGKTLAAMLPVLDFLFLDEGPGLLRCLYIAPLKALATDVANNLTACVESMQAFHPAAAGPRVSLRTGDTSAAVRQEQRNHPPAILVTTPESLAVLLSQPAWTEIFRDLRFVIVDEVHAVAGNKRGADLALSLERLTEVRSAECGVRSEQVVRNAECGMRNEEDDSSLSLRTPHSAFRIQSTPHSAFRIQRIGLSATCRPLAMAARFLVGAGRPCAIGEVSESSDLQLTIEPLEPGGAFLPRLVDRLEPELTANRSTLIFTNVRSLAEKVTWALRRRFPKWADQIAAHHSSLDGERRREVERQFKAGQLRAVVSSTSLELGIDIGSVDAVVLVHPPGGVVRLRQRLGRAGHAPGRPQRGLVLTATATELLEATVTGAAGRSAQFEPLSIPPAPLDVLCQQLAGMAVQKTWQVDEAFHLVRRAAPYRELARADFDACLDYLSGRHRDGRNWLPTRLSWDGDHFTVTDRRTGRLVRRNLGTIIAEESRQVVEMVHGDDDELATRTVGEVEIAFADHLKAGDRFLLDGRCLEVRRTEGEALLVEERFGQPRVPRWEGNAWDLATDLAGRLYEFRVRAAEALREGPRLLARLLRQEYGLETRAIEVLVQHFQRQEIVSEIPDAATCLIEVVPNGPGVDYHIHTPLNRAGNDALGRVLVRRMTRDHGWLAEVVPADLGLGLYTRRPVVIPAETFRELLGEKGFADDLTQALADCDSLRERFRCVALTGLMLLRNPLGAKRRVGGAGWPQRRLFDKVRDADPEFVLLRQALREVRATVVDEEAAASFVRELPRRRVHWRRLPRVSPFAESWTQAASTAVTEREDPAEALKRLHAALWTEDRHARA